MGLILIFAQKQSNYAASKHNKNYDHIQAKKPNEMRSFAAVLPNCKTNTHHLQKLQNNCSKWVNRFGTNSQKSEPVSKPSFCSKIMGYIQLKAKLIKIQETEIGNRKA